MSIYQGDYYFSGDQPGQGAFAPPLGQGQVQYFPLGIGLSLGSVGDPPPSGDPPPFSDPSPTPVVPPIAPELPPPIPIEVPGGIPDPVAPSSISVPPPMPVELPPPGSGGVPTVVTPTRPYEPPGVSQGWIPEALGAYMASNYGRVPDGFDIHEAGDPFMLEAINVMWDKLRPRGPGGVLSEFLYTEPLERPTRTGMSLAPDYTGSIPSTEGGWSAPPTNPPGTQVGSHGELIRPAPTGTGFEPLPPIEGIDFVTPGLEPGPWEPVPDSPLASPIPRPINYPLRFPGGYGIGAMIMGPTINPDEWSLAPYEWGRDSQRDEQYIDEMFSFSGNSERFRRPVPPLRSVTNPYTQFLMSQELQRQELERQGWILPPRPIRQPPRNPTAQAAQPDLSARPSLRPDGTRPFYLRPDGSLAVDPSYVAPLPGLEPVKVDGQVLAAAAGAVAVAV